jgi:antirestriction protein
MNTQKSVFKKLSAIEKVEDKVELSEERVEFAIKDYDNYLNQILDEFQKIQKQIGQLGTVANDLQQLNKIAGQASVDAANILQKAEQQMKEDTAAADKLGVSDREIIGKFVEVKNQYGKLQKLADRMTRAASGALKAIRV